MSVAEIGAKRVGTTLREKWVLEQLLGVGGMASVYVARHKIGRRDAIKILHPEIASSEDLRARFEQEAHAVNSLRHPGAVEIRDIDVTEDGAPFLVMELLEGETVAERARRPPPLGIAEILRIGAETLDVLDAAHAKGIIHRDIKPDNLFLTRAGAVKVLDFGIARVRAAGARAMATQAGMMLGTMAYMPPEQARGLEIDARADLYAVGATLYGLLSGRIVHDAATESELVMKAMSEPAVPLARVAPAVPAHVCAVIDRALAFDRSSRYPDAKTMKADLEAAARGEAPPHATAASPLPTQAPSSEFFALRPSFFGELPEASQAAPSAGGLPSAARPPEPPRAEATPPAALGNPTRVEGGAKPSVASFSAASPGVAIAPLASPTRGPAPASAAERPPPTPTIVSGPRAVVVPAPIAPTAPTTRPPPTALLVAIAAGAVLVVVLAFGTIVALALLTRRDAPTAAEDEPGSSLAEPLAAPTARESDSKGEDKKTGDKKGKANKKKGREREP